MALNNTGVSFTATAAGGLGVADLGDLVQWGLDKFPQPAPHSVALSVAALLILGAHVAYALLTRSKDPIIPAAPAASPRAQEGQ